MNRPAKVVEYVPIHSTVTGCGFVYWPPVESHTTAGAVVRAGAAAR
jgi:hypothetical protein